MKKIILISTCLFLFQFCLHAQEEVYLTDFYISVGYKNQPFNALNQRLEENGYDSFSEHVGALGLGFSYLPTSRIGIFAETEMNVNRKIYNNDNLSYRYLPVHVTAGIQYHFSHNLIPEWNFYPKLGVFYGTTSLDLISNHPNRDFNENLMGAMNTSFLYQDNYGFNISFNADKLIGTFLQPTTQIGIYSRMGLQVGYMLNIFNGKTKLRRNFNPTLRDDFSMRNSPVFNPSAFYAKINFALGKFKGKIDQ